MRIALGAAQSGIWTALPGIIQSFDPQAMTCTVQPSISLQQRGSDGTMSPINLPVLLDCPVIFPTGGGCTLTFPIKQGDECLVLFSSRCIDSWWQQGGIQGQARLRMHDLSDGFVMAGPRSQPRVLSPSVNTSTVQLRSDDGQAFVEIHPTSHQIHAKTSADVIAEAGTNITATAGGFAHVTATAEITLAAPIINLTAGQINLAGNLTQTAGTGGSTGTATMIGPVTVQNQIKSNTEVVAVTTPLHTHAHQGGNGSATLTSGPTP